MDRLKVYNLRSLNKVRADERGYAVQMEDFASGRNLHIKNLYFGVIKPNEVRGNHYHLLRNEWLVIFGGKYILTWEDDGNLIQREIEKSEILVFEVSKGCAHAVKNISTNEIFFSVFVDFDFDIKEPDTYKKRLI